MLGFHFYETEEYISCHDDFKNNFLNIFHIFNKIYKPLLYIPEKELDEICFIRKINFKTSETWLIFLFIIFHFISLLSIINETNSFYIKPLFLCTIFLFVWAFKVNRTCQNMFLHKINILPKNIDIIYLLNAELKFFSSEQLKRAIAYARKAYLPENEKIPKKAITLLGIPIFINLFSDILKDLISKFSYEVFDAYSPYFALIISISIYFYFLLNARKLRMKVFQEKIQYILELRKTYNYPESFLNE